MRRIIAALTTAAALVGVAAPAHAQTAGPQRMTVYAQFSDGGANGRAIAALTGVVNGVGPMELGTDDASGIHHDTVVLAGGTVELASIETSDTTVFNSLTCTGQGVQSGTSTLSGTGRYAALSGQATWTQRAIIVAPWSPSCTIDDVTTGHVVMTLSGSVSLG